MIIVADNNGQLSLSDPDNRNVTVFDTVLIKWPLFYFVYSTVSA